MIPDAHCQTCALYSPNPYKPGIGQCRAHAPVLMMTEQGQRTMWPLTHGDSWCGDHAVVEGPEA